MFATLISVALFSTLAIQGVLADITVQTPKLTQCGKVTFKWEETKAPYNVIVVSSTDPCGDVLADLGDVNDNQVKWTVKYPPGTKLMVSVEDANGEEGWTSSMLVHDSADDSCVPADLKPPTSGTSDPPPPDNSAPPVPVGAANAGGSPFGVGQESGALTMRQLSTPAMALSALIAAAATFAL